MKRIFIALAFMSVLLGPLLSHSQDKEPPHFRFSGANLAEKEVRLAWFHLPIFLLTCYFSDQCELTEEQKKLAFRSLEVSANYNQDTVVFKSEKANPEIFRSSRGEIHRLAMTGSDPKSPIYINSDRLVQNGKSLGVAAWMGILAHELMHHLGHEDDEKRVPDQMGAAIAKAAEAFWRRWEISKSDGQLQVWILNLPIPKSTAYLKHFPNGYHPRVVVYDSVEIYNAADISGGWIMRDVCKTGQSFVTGIMNPQNEIVSAEKEFGVWRANLLYQTHVVCFDSKERQLVGHNSSHSLKFDFVQKGERTELNSRTMIYGPGSGDDLAGAESRVEVVDVRLLSSRIQAGHTLVFEATMRDIGMEQKPKSCGASFSRPDWPVFDTGNPHSVYHSSCEIVERPTQNADLYRVKVTLQIDPKAAPGPLTIDRVCLSPLTDPHEGCYTAAPPKKLQIEILNRAQPPLAIKEARIEGAKPLAPSPDYSRYYHVEKGKTYRLVLEVEGTDEVIQGHMVATSVSDQDKQFNMTGPLIPGGEEVIKSKRVTRKGPRLVLEFEILMPIEIFDLRQKFKLMKFWKLVVISRDLKATEIEFKPYDFAVMFTDYVPDSLR